MLNADVEANWPALPLDGWSDTYATVHRWVQIVGKVRLTQSPWVNHSWHVTLYVSSRGLTTGSIPYDERSFQIDFDFIQHRLQIHSTEGKRGGFDLVPESVAAFYGKLMREMERLGLPVTIYGKPCELEDALPFADDTAHCAYDRDAVHRFWRILVQADRVLKIFRARFLGKASPVHLFWGALDLAVTRFSGRPAPQHPGGIPNLPDWVTREAYSQEVSSCGFWPGGGPLPYPLFYAYAYPEPAGFAQAALQSEGAFYSTDFREFVLPYDSVRRSPTPDAVLLDFLQSTYEATANLAHWDRAALERAPDDALSAHAKLRGGTLGYRK